MYVIKRDGKKESVKFDKIFTRIKKQVYSLDSEFVDPHEISKKVIEGIYDGITTKQLDILAAEVSASLSYKHPDFAILASRIEVSSLHKETSKSFSDTISKLYNYKHNEHDAGLINEEIYNIILNNSDILNSAIVYDRDFNFDYFGFKTLEKSYLLKINNKVVERPQHLWMRVSVGIWKDNIEEVIKTYELMSQGFFTHATPTLFNSGTKRPQNASCFLFAPPEDSIEGIYETIKNLALTSKFAGGLGTPFHTIRGASSYIKGTNGKSNGILPFLKVIN